MDDLVERCRSLADCDARAGDPLGKCLREAAAAIEELQRQLGEAREVEREACAVLVETKTIYHSKPPSRAVSYPSAMFRYDVARAIRERGHD